MNHIAGVNKMVVAFFLIGASSVARAAGNPDGAAQEAVRPLPPELRGTAKANEVREEIRQDVKYAIIEASDEASRRTETRLTENQAKYRREAQRYAPKRPVAVLVIKEEAAPAKSDCYFCNLRTDVPLASDPPTVHEVLGW